MQINVWLKANATLYLGGDPAKGTQPAVTVTLTKPQVLVDPEKNTIVVLETK